MAYEIDPIDRQIITILQQDGRRSNVDMARQVGVSEATVRKRLERLLSEDVVRITAMPNPAKVGLATVTFLTFDVDLAQIDRVQDELARLPPVRSIYYTTGESDLIAEAWFPSNRDLLQFLTHHIASIPGIKRTATSHVLRTLKDCSTWTLPTGVPPRILVVDDDPDFVEVTRLGLGAAGFEVFTASNGEEALAAMRLNKPDLVILDIMMRGLLDGLRTGREMRTNGDLRSVPIVMVSSIPASALARLMSKEESLPADNFLVKPVDMDELTAEIRHLLQLR